MALDTRYTTAPSLQQYFVDKDSGAPLAGGKVFFYSDVNRTQLKDVYTLQGNQANYTYEPLPNPVILSSVGTIQDNNGNDVIEYYFPFNEDNTSEQELYYIVVEDASGVPQFTRSAWPSPPLRSGSGGDSLRNLTPNGQFLSHTDLPNDGLLGPGETVIAQGGYEVVLDEPVFSTNRLTFSTQGYTLNPTQSPRYTARLTCETPFASETNKRIRVKFKDVNKFSTEGENLYTFAFWSLSNVPLSASIDVYKFFGTNGSPSERITQATTTIDTVPTYIENVFSIDFEGNEGASVDTENNDDYVAIDISLPTGLAFDLQFTNFTLVRGEVALQGYPVQTDADMLTRGVAGWMDTPNPDGSDLYCPLVLTREGMTFDKSLIGKIYMETGDIPSPDSSSATSNDMPMDGSSYVASDYSALGIPYSRLRDVLIEKSPLADYPIFGTGPSFATAKEAGSDEILLATNTSGTPISTATNVGTPFTFIDAISYAGSFDGGNSLNLIASHSSGSGLVVRQISSSVGNVINNGGLSSFTVQNGVTGLYSFQGLYGFTAVAFPASSLGGGNRWFQVNASPTGGTAYSINYTINGVGAVSGPGFQIVLNLDDLYTNTDVSFMTACALSAFQITRITIDAVPAPNVSAGAAKYFTFETNPSSIEEYYVWYRYSNLDEDPSGHGAAGVGIRIDLTATDTPATVRAKTARAINAYQFYVPDLSGMFVRGGDPNVLFDTDAANRLGFGSALGGNNYGTFEYQQFLNHDHTMTESFVDAGPDVLASSVVVPAGTRNVTLSGGNETRPTNFNVNWIIKY